MPTFFQLHLPWILAVFLTFFTLFSPTAKGASTPETAPAARSAVRPSPELIHYDSHGLSLKGYLYKPQGTGPFPAYVWNHGSEQNPSNGQRLANFWTAQGFVFFAPIRSGHGGNAGDYIGEEQKEIRQALGRRNRGGAFPQVAKLHERANDDVVAALDWLKKQTFVDTKRIVVAGGSFGGIQTLLTAERDGWKDLGVNCFIAMGPAAMSWGPGWSARLSQAVQNAKSPIFLIQAANDYSVGPSQVLGPQVDAKGFPNRHKIFPTHVLPGGDPNDPQQGHGRFFGDVSAWQEDVLKYLKDCHVIY